jgi:Zn-dependent protease
MAQVVDGKLRLGRVLGVEVFLHWSWLLVAVIELQTRKSQYSTQLWNVGEYLTLFAIILAHELGHALACRSVGGRADRILLWPLGGIAFVQPPSRPGAVLWSIAAGPLVNVVFALASRPFFSPGPPELLADPAKFANAFYLINVGLLIFNLMPIYPLDGGQIVQSLLWFVVGRAKSLGIVSVIGLLGAAAVASIAVARGSFWFAAIALYAGMRAMTGLRQARLLGRIAAAPKRQGVACPRCAAHPPIGEFWRCACGQMFDTFAGEGRCPKCSRTFEVTGCVECNQPSRHAAFYPTGSYGTETPPV